MPRARLLLSMLIGSHVITVITACPSKQCPQETVCAADADCVEGRVCDNNSGCCVDDGE